ncbi:threonylcarbamoyladenosine tRNA methylthiotransferase-like [Hibiscus syriacus]|uniref:Threonylcarbamoyladenosine tRNA methylthiotransferase-like n=1 Tax=Hibiscus syriacus TaxID=106335 RepID=A0A6A2YSB3_HIBSY|nr:FT-interacting protein 7-like [Hibiscus syriacus]KAE8682229.1 threonylcarbamoyladenosine tRNA methylthiotransferase-like [Hibiscus syriacus]
MSKLVVEVVEAVDLMPKDEQGSSSPFVEVEFDGQRQRTQTKHKDLNPSWNEKFVFDVNNPGDLEYKTVVVTVYNDKQGDRGHHRNFLGRVKISGGSVPSSESGSGVQRYPLDKRGLFSNIKGDIALKIYGVHDGVPQEPVVQRAVPERVVAENEETGGFEEPQSEKIPFEEIDTNSYEEEVKVEEKEKKKEKEQEVRTFHSIGTDTNSFDEEVKVEEKKEKKKKEQEARTFHSIGTGASGPPPAPPQSAPPPVKEKPPVVDTRADFAKAAPPAASVMHMQMPRQNPDYLLVETRPPVAAHLRYRGGDKTLTTYDLVEQMHYLYVNVVKAKDLPVMDLSGSLDPYVEVKLGNYKGQTKHLEKNQNPVWHQIFAFSKERVQSNLLEVVVKDKDFGKDDFVGKVVFDVMEIPLRVPPDSPLAPQWYRLADKRGDKIRGEIMLAVWMGTQADESFPEAWHSDAHNISHSNLANTRSKVYFSPKLYYLRVHVMEAQDLVPHDKGRLPDPYVKVILGNQIRPTKVQQRTVHPVWDDQLMFVASEPFEDYIIISVEDRIGPGKDEILGRAMISLREVPQRLETGKPPDPRWLSLLKPSKVEEEGEKKKEKFSSKILLRFFLEAGYHVLDESTHFSSDLQPSSKHLRKPSIGILELGILSARNLLPMKMKEGKMTDAYCVAKYGNKWVRTRTLLDTLTPRWNEQYTWEVHDPCTVITIGVFDNAHTNGSKDDARDQKIGKVRVRLSTLEIDRVYTHYYPLLVLTPSGLKKHGELQLALRFTCTAWVNMVAQYGRPLLPKMHYVNPIPVMNIDWLRHQAMQIVAARLQRAEPPLRREVVEYMLDVDYHMWSLRRSKANFHRIMSVLSGVTAVCKWFNDICYWRNPITTCLVHVLFLMLICYPELILPTIFLYLFVIGIWNYRFRPRHPPHMDARLSQADNAHPDELDEEFDSFPTSRPSDIVRMRYDRLRSVAGRVQTVVGDLASQGERAQAILSWRDSRATAIFIILSLIWAVFIYVTPFQVVAVLFGLYWLRHPRFRSKLPSVPVNFFKRLPSKSDMLI